MESTFYTVLLRSLKTLGLTGVQLVISDAYAGFKAAIVWRCLVPPLQRGQVRFLRYALAPVPRGPAEMVAAGIRTVFAWPRPVRVRDQLGTIAATLARTSRRWDEAM